MAPALPGLVVMAILMRSRGDNATHSWTCASKDLHLCIRFYRLGQRRVAKQVIYVVVTDTIEEVDFHLARVASRSAWISEFAAAQEGSDAKGVGAKPSERGPTRTCPTVRKPGEHNGGCRRRLAAPLSPSNSYLSAVCKGDVKPLLETACLNG